jgi:hypothetical protein
MIRQMLPILAALLILPAGAGATGDAEGALSASDRDRLASFEAVRAETLAAVRGRADPVNLATLDAVVTPQPQAILGVDLRGNYRCRTIKLGGAPALVIYGWFSCRIDEDDLGYRLVKLTGSQRLSGHFIDTAEDRLTWWGALHYADEAPKPYGADPERDQVGYLFRIGEGHYRLELPLPHLESRFDILEIEMR